MIAKKVLHIWGVTENNFGDIVIGDATKYWFHKNIDSTVLFDNDTCRKIYDKNIISKINNEYDYVLLGAGGLILPDTAPNKNSGWQWNITEKNIAAIKIPIYVVSIGYNLFYKQKIGMPYKDIKKSYKFYPKLLKKFNNNISSLIETSQYFSLRHSKDLDLLKKHIPTKLYSKLQFQFCPTIEYTKFLIEKLNIKKELNNIWGIEIKEDRINRRLYKIKESVFYNNIVKFINYVKTNKPDIELVILNSHQNNIRFIKHLQDNNITLPIIKNYGLDNKDMITNLVNIERLYCMGGHSQMIGYACGCDVRSIITHDKLKFFLEDIDQFKYEKYIDPNTENIFDKLIETV